MLILSKTSVEILLFQSTAAPKYIGCNILHEVMLAWSSLQTEPDSPDVEMKDAKP